MAIAELMKPNVLLHYGQSTVYYDQHRFKVVVAGRRWGKTNVSKNALIKAAHIPNKKVWYIAPSYRMAKQIMWDDLKWTIPRSWIKGKPNETELSVRLRNGSMIECKGADDPDSLRGVGLAYTVLDEFQDMKPDVWTKVLRPTLAKDRGGALFIGTPKGYANIYNVYQIGLDEKHKQWKSWLFKTSDSPFIPTEEIEAARLDLDAKTFRQEFEASFESMSGRVYYEFDRNVHVGDYKFNPALPIWIGMDFNVSPMTAVVLQPQMNGDIFAVDELFLNDSNTLEVCLELEKRYWRYMNNITMYPDPAVVSRSHARGESSLDIMREKGFRRIKFRKKHPAVRDRVNAVNAQFLNASGDIRLKIDRSCTNVIQSCEQVLYKTGSNDIDKSLDMEHITDALGYPIELERSTRRIIIAGRSI